GGRPLMKSAQLSSDPETLSVGPPLQSFVSEPQRHGSSAGRRKSSAVSTAGDNRPTSVIQLATELSRSAKLELLTKLLAQLPPDDLIGLAEMILQRLRGKKR